MNIKSIDYRNGTYQGSLNVLMREGVGLFIDMDMKFIISEWHNNLINGDSLIFLSHGKYLYGQWKEGKPSGINIFRSGDMILFANYDKGKIKGQFIVIYQKQNLGLLMQFNKNSCSIITKKQNIDLKQIEHTIRNMKFNNGDIKQKYFSLKEFIKESFINKLANLILKQQKDSLYLGFDNGVGIILDNNNFIKFIGSHLNQDGKLNGIGGKYSQDSCQEGDFSINQSIKYVKNNKPIKKIRQILKNYSRRSLNYLNQYVIADIDSTFDYIDNLFKQKIVHKLPQTKKQQTKQYKQVQNHNHNSKPKTQNERLKELRQELYQSITRINPNKQSKMSSSASMASITTLNTVKNQKIILDKHDQNKINKKKQQLNINPKSSKFIYDKTQQLKRSAIQQENTFEVQKYQQSDERKQIKKYKTPQRPSTFSFLLKKYQDKNPKEKIQAYNKISPLKLNEQKNKNMAANQPQKNKLVYQGQLNSTALANNSCNMKWNSNYSKKYQQMYQNEIVFRTPPKQILSGGELKQKKNKLDQQMIKKIQIVAASIEQPDSIYNKNQVTARFKSGNYYEYEKYNGKFQKSPNIKLHNNSYKNQQNIYSYKQFQSPDVPKYQKIQQKRQRLLRQYQHLRNEKSPNMNINNNFSKSTYLVSTKPKKQSPCKQINLESERENLQINQKFLHNNQITTSRKCIPVLHDKSNITNLNSKLNFQQHQNFPSFQKFNSKESINKQYKEEFRIQLIKTPMDPVITPQENKSKTGLERTPRKFSYLADIEM